MLAGMRYTADFEYLRRLNGDTVGWLFQEGTGLNQPVTQGKDNTEYANHTFGGRVYRYGSVFLDFENAPDFSQTVSYVYGNSSGKRRRVCVCLREYTRPGIRGRASIAAPADALGGLPGGAFRGR